MNFLINHFYIFLSITFAVSSQLIIKWQMSHYDLNHLDGVIEKFSFALNMLSNPFILLSILFTLFSGLSWMIAMTKFDISYAYPFTTLGFVLIFLFSILLFQEIFTWQKFIGLIFIIIGILITSKST